LPLLSLEYISSDEKVTAGELVLTSGQDRIFPKDLPVGTVVDFSSDPKSPFMKIRVRPAAHLDRLEEVLVLETRQDLNLKRTADADPAPAAPPATPKAVATPAVQKSTTPSATPQSMTPTAAAPKPAAPKRAAPPAAKNAPEAPAEATPEAAPPLTATKPAGDQ
jgi:rod shape-determining protein MreC